MIREQFGVIGLGACGSNIANLFEQKQYTTVYINSNLEDLEAIKGIHKLHLVGAEGAAKERKKVLELAMESFGDIVQKIQSIITQKYVIVAYSGSGGTGSGLSTPILQYLTQQGKICIPVMVLPNEAIESAKSAENTYNAYVELANIQGLGATFLLDNSRGDKFAINNRFVNEFDSFINLKNISVHGNFDISERKKILSCPGVAVIGKSSKLKSNASDVVESLNNGIYAENESKTAYYLGVSSSNKSLDINSIAQSFVGIYDIFQGVGESSTLSIVAGLQWPTRRFVRFRNKFEETVKTINETNMMQELTPLQPLQGLSFEVQKPKQQVQSNNPRDILMNLMQM